MKLRLLILLAAALAAAPAAGQTIKSLGFNTTNGSIVYSGTNDLRFPATIRIGTNQSGFSSGGQFLTLTDGAGGVAMIIGTNAITLYDPIAFSSTGNAATTRTNLALGETNNVTFSNITANGIVTANDSTATPATNAAAAQGIQWPGLGGSQHAAIYGGYPGAAQIALAVGTSNALTDVATFRATGMTVNSNAIVGGTLAVSNAATFSTNVTVNGNLSVGSLTTTTPSTWALDATQTAAATNGILALPSNANVIRLTNNNAISGVSGGVLGAFYYLVNQTTNAVTISNVGGISVQGATPLTLGVNQAATLVATGATNASVAARGNLTDVALGGTANTAPSQTASSGSSLMTRDLVDTRSLNTAINTMPNLRYNVITASGGTVLDSPWNSGVYTAAATNSIGFGFLMIPFDSMQFASEQAPYKGWVFTRVATAMATNVSNSVSFGIVGTTNSTEFPVQSATSTNPAYVSYGANYVDDNRYAVQLRRNGSDLQARFIAMRQASPSGVYFETAWTNILSGVSGEFDLAARPVVIALNRNGTNVSAYYGNTDAGSSYEDFNSLTLLGSYTLSEASASSFGIGFRAVNISGDTVRAEFLNTTAVITP